jgi:hypothetical protein
MLGEWRGAYIAATLAQRRADGRLSRMRWMNPGEPLILAVGLAPLVERPQPADDASDDGSEGVSSRPADERP